MFFTQEDYRKIEKWLLANSVKDTEFARASLPLKGNETVAFVQDGKNVNVFLKDLIEQIFLLGVSDFLNVTDKYGESRISLTQAIQLIPYKSRKIGQVITFLDEDGEWKLFQFQGERVNQWNNATLWVDLIKRIQGISIIDSEDITATVDNLNQTSLTFADKNYNTTDYSGLGRVYLRKNIQSVVNPNTGITYSTNLLTQDMLSKENTIYIIQYDYSLNYQTITIPEGCVLQFEGGSISTGTLSGNNTIITAEPYNIFKTIGFAGTFNIEKVIPEWFGAKGDNSTINTKPFQDAIDFAEFAATNVEFQSGDYVIDGTLYIRKQSRIHITGMGKYKTFIYLKTTSPVNSMIDINSPEVTTYYQFIRIKDLSLYVNNNADYGIYAPKLTASEIDSITIFGASNYALRIEHGWSNILYNSCSSSFSNTISRLNVLYRLFLRAVKR